ncbi:MAG: NADPH-dependent F420 reductase [Fimbriimonas sp.]
MKIAIIGRGNVGATLGQRWTSIGHDVRYGVRRPGEADEADAATAVAESEVVILALPAGGITPEFIGGLPLAGKVVVDATNPIAADFGGLNWGEESSWGERVARFAPGAIVVKAFNTIGFNVMANPDFAGTPASLLIAGDDAPSKAIVSGLAREIGFAPVDAGPLLQSRYLEAQAWLWISMAAKYGHGREIAFNLVTR